MNPILQLIQDRHEYSLSLGEISEIIIEIQSLIKTKKFEDLEKILDLLNDKSSSSALVCILVATSGVKDQLKNWRATVSLGRTWVKARGENDLIIFKDLP